MGALSKPWGGCGITIGWLALQDLDLKQRLVDVQYFGTASPSRASELQAPAYQCYYHHYYYYCTQVTY